MSDKDLPIGYRNTENPDVIEVFYFVKAQVRRDAITHDHGRIVTAMQLYEAGEHVGAVSRAAQADELNKPEADHDEE